MLEIVTLFVQAVSLAMIAGWLTLGVRDNLIHPELNEPITAQVLSMDRMRAEYPEDYARVAHRAITDPGTQKLAFRAAVIVELIAAGILWLGVAALVLALAGAVGVDTARAVALLGAALFTSVWAGFLVIGNHYCYWFGHTIAQNTHFLMTLWGIGLMLLLLAG